MIAVTYDTCRGSIYSSRRNLQDKHAQLNNLLTHVVTGVHVCDQPQFCEDPFESEDEMYVRCSRFDSQV
jgi:hypothetical protein